MKFETTFLGVQLPKYQNARELSNSSRKGGCSPISCPRSFSLWLVIALGAYNGQNHNPCIFRIQIEKGTGTLTALEIQTDVTLRRRITVPVLQMDWQVAALVYACEE